MAFTASVAIRADDYTASVELLPPTQQGFRRILSFGTGLLEIRDLLTDKVVEPVFVTSPDIRYRPVLSPKSSPPSSELLFVCETADCDHSIAVFSLRSGKKIGTLMPVDRLSSLAALVEERVAETSVRIRACEISEHAPMVDPCPHGVVCLPSVFYDNSYWFKPRHVEAVFDTAACTISQVSVTPLTGDDDPNNLLTAGRPRVLRYPEDLGVDPDEAPRFAEHAFSRDGRLLAVSLRDCIAIFDLGAEDVKCREVMRIQLERPVYHVSFVAGGTLLAVSLTEELRIYSIPLGGKVVLVRRPSPSADCLCSCVRDDESDEWMMLEGWADAKEEGMPDQRVFERWNRREAMGEH
jgi:hypothetical protein